MNILAGLALVTAGIAAVMDVKSMQVDNGWLLFTGILGFLIRVYAEGWKIIPDFIFGGLFPFLLLIGLYAFHMLGAGDIKLLCVLGSMFGVQKAGILMLWTLFLGGGISALILISCGNIRERFRYFFHYIRECALTGVVKPYYKTGMQLENFHFTVPIFLSTVLCTGGLF